MQIRIVTQLQLKGFAFTIQLRKVCRTTSVHVTVVSSIGQTWSLDGIKVTRHTRIEENPTLKIEDVRYKSHCWTATDVLRA